MVLPPILLHTVTQLDWHLVLVVLIAHCWRRWLSGSVSLSTSANFLHSPLSLHSFQSSLRILKDTTINCSPQLCQLIRFVTVICQVSLLLRHRFCPCMSLDVSSFFIPPTHNAASSMPVQLKRATSSAGVVLNWINQKVRSTMIRRSAAPCVLNLRERSSVAPPGIEHWVNPRLGDIRNTARQRTSSFLSR